MIKAIVSLLFLAGIICLSQQPQAYWQSRQQSSIVSASSGVVLDNCGTEQLSSNVVTAFDYTGSTISGGLANSVFVLIISTTGTLAAASVPADWDHTGTPQTMTQLAEVNNTTGPQVILYGLRNPTAGNLTAHIGSWTGATQIAVVGCSFSGVNVTNDGTAFTNAATQNGNHAPQSVTVTSAVGDYVLAGFSSGVNFTSTSATQIYVDNSGVAWAAAANRTVGASPSVVMQGNPGSATVATAGINLSAAP